MALTVKTGSIGGNVISILFDGSTPWDSATSYPDGLVIESMEFVPAATDDILIVRESIATGVQYFQNKAATVHTSKIKYFNVGSSVRRLYPYVVGAEATTGVLLIITLK